MLPKAYVFTLVNNTGEDATFDSGALLSLRITQWKFNPSGVLVYNTVVDNMNFAAGQTILDGGVVNSDDFDNSSDLFLGLNGVLEATHDVATALGRWDLFVQGSDSSGNFPESTDNFDVEQDATVIDSLRVANTGEDQSTALDFSYE